MADYGYFGKGAEGYAHYSQTFKSTFPNSSSSGSRSNSRSTAHSSPCPQVGTAKKSNTKDASDEVDVLLKIVVPLVILMFVFLK